MISFQSVLWRIRALFSRKLGVCAFCMRTSGMGALLAWGIYTGAHFAHPHPVVGAFLLTVAAAFTLLMLAHIVAYVARVVMRWREAERPSKNAGRPQDTGIRRREFIALVVRASAYAIAVSVPGAARVFAQMFPPCEGIHGQTENPAAAVEGAGLTAAAATTDYIRKAQQVCHAFCANTKSHSPCPPAGTCVQTAPPVVEDPKPGSFGQFILKKGRVKECICGCRSCVGDHVPVAGDDVASGGTAGEVDADALRKCNKICERLKDCILPPNCKAWDFKLGKKKHTAPGGQVTITAQILKCSCNCLP